MLVLQDQEWLQIWRKVLLCTSSNLRIGPQEETEWQEQGAREAAWKLAKSVVKIKRSKKEQHSSHLRKIGACLHQFLKLEEREFVVDSGASMHMISKKDLNIC